MNVMMLRAVRLIAPVFLVVATATSASYAETAYFLMSGPSPLPIGASKMPQSYAIAVTDAALIQEAREYLRNGAGGKVLIPRIGIAPGEDAVNRDHTRTGDPRWPWHATALLEWALYDPYGPQIALVDPRLYAEPAGVKELLNRDPPITEVSLVYYPLVMELIPGHGAVVSNLSTRGWVGAGDKVLIAGFIVEGGEPQNILLRARGPSLAGFGVSDPLQNPVITLFRDGEKIGENDSWTTTAFGQMAIPEWWLTPLADVWPLVVNLDTREPVLLLSLPPGAYTVHVSGGGGSTGVAIVELFDRERLSASLVP
jgi:hypothetical protein